MWLRDGVQEYVWTHAFPSLANESGIREKLDFLRVEFRT
jgi:hypothetical protein